MACRRQKQLDPSGRHVPSNVDHLAFKYMEMCKVESSTDSESEVSPRWSDNSTMGCPSSAPESESTPKTLPLMHKAAGRHGCYSLFLDPYDGSSEDSDQSMDIQCSRRTQQATKAGICRYMPRSRRLHHSYHHLSSEKNVIKESQNTPMSCETYSELDTLLSYSEKEESMHSPSMELDQNDSGLFERSGLKLGLTHMLESSSERSPSPSNLYKRKFGIPGPEAVDVGQRKRQCVISMEEEGVDSAFEAALDRYTH